MPCCAPSVLVAPAYAQNSAGQAVAGAGPDLTSLQAIETQVAQIRGLEPLSEPDLRVLDPRRAHNYLVETLEHDYLPS